MSSILLYDTLMMDDVPRKTSDGYVVGTAKAARIGIQIYSGAEVGRPTMQVVRVYRPEEEVFHIDSLRSYAYRPMTNDHPKESVDATTWKKYAVGQIGGEVARDGNAIRVPMVLMDAAAIKDWDGGKRQLSMGYFSELVWKDGTTPQGEQYDAMQTNIRANHLAIVAAARGGPELKLGDQDTLEEDKMTMPAVAPALRTTMVDGLSCEMTDGASQIVARHIQALTDRITKAEKDLLAEADEFRKFKKLKEEYEAESKKKIETKDGEIAVLKKQIEDAKVGPAQVDKLVADRIAVVTTARKILGDKLVIDGKTDADIRKQAVAAKMGDATIKDWSEDTIKGAFNALTVGDSQTNDTLATALSSIRPSATVDADREKAWKDNVDYIKDAYRGSAGKAA